MKRKSDDCAETIVIKVQWKNNIKNDPLVDNIKNEPLEDNIKNEPLGDNIKRRQNFAYCSSNKQASIQMKLLV